MRLAVFVTLLFCAIFAVAQSNPLSKSPDGVRSEMLVSTQWLSQHLKDPNVIVLHLADNILDYKRGHIPGARYLAMDKISTNVGDVNVEFPSVEKLQQAFSELGVGDNTRVIIYATNWFPDGARAWFTLDYLGHGDKAALLDGGIEQWLTEDRPVNGDTPRFSAATFTPHVHDNYRALLDEVKTDVDAKPDDAPEQILDARPERRYKAGHLAGSTNIYWQDTLVNPDNNPVFKSPDQLRALYAAKGIVPGKKIVTYCEVGLQGSHAYFLAKYLGYDAALYDGSYQEWSQKKLPDVKGDAKR